MPENTASDPVRPYRDDPVGFVVVGLGKGANLAETVTHTPGTRLVGVCDIDEVRARRVSEALHVPYELDVRRWLERPEVEVVYVVTPTGRHLEVAAQAIAAGKHVLSTKPMEASLEASTEMIRLAEKAGVLLGVDFMRRFHTETVTLKAAVAKGVFGRLLSGMDAHRAYRSPEYFQESGGWRGTKRWDGGGVMSNQAVHDIDAIAYTVGIPARVRCDVWTQDHDIEAEDLAISTWAYANGLVFNFYATTAYPGTWGNPRLELHGNKGAYYAESGGRLKKASQQWFLNGVWSDTPPEVVASEWLNAADNYAAAVRLGVPLTCDGRDGRRTQSILDALYRSAYSGGPWVNVAADL